jgi:S1-C subfamily serine protease
VPEAVLVRARRGDAGAQHLIYTAVAAATLTSGSHATRILSSYQPGEKIALRVIRDHKTLELQTTVPERGVHDAHAHVDTQPRVIAVAPYSDET